MHCLTGEWLLLMSAAISLAGGGALWSLQNLRQARRLSQARRRLIEQRVHLEERERQLALAGERLKAPLAGILTLARQPGALVWGEDQRALRTIEARARQLLGGIQGMVSEVAHAGQVDVGAMVAELVQHLPARQDRAVVEVEGKLPPALADPVRLLCVLGNLMDNALKFSSGTSPVRLRIRHIDGFIRLEVADLGAGMGKHELEHCFDCYWRGPRAVAGGLGLGLYVARQLTLQMRGRLEVHSQPGRGSTFIIFLPAAGDN